MLIRIVRGKLIPGKWDEFEKAYLAAVAAAGPIDGLDGRWLVQDINDPDSGSTISLWRDEQALRKYEGSDLLKKEITEKLTPFFSGQYDVRISKVKFAEGEPAPSDWLGTGDYC